MKKIILMMIMIVPMFAQEAVTNYSAEGLIDESKGVVLIWKTTIEDVKTNGFSFGWLVGLFAIILGSLTVLAKITDWVILLLIKVLPDNVDAKLFKVREKLTLVLGWVAKIAGWLSFTKKPETKK